jgi:SAM-dependent methyltransferase
MSSVYFKKIYSSWKNIQEKKYEVILELLNKNRINLSKKLILDLGCGPFFFEEFLEKNKIETKNFILLDKDKELDRKRNFVIADFNNLPFKSEIFHIVFCIDSFHFLNNFNELKRVVKKGGILLISQFLRMNEDELLKKLKEFDDFKVLDEFLFNWKEREIIILLRKC